MLECKFCSRICKNHNSLRNHERMCKSNPNRQKSPFENLEVQKNKRKNNQFLSGKQITHSEETREKLRVAALKQVISEETRKKLSIAAKKNGFGGHTSKQKLYFKKNNGDVVYLQSSYEVRFAQILEELSIEWERPKPLIWIDDIGSEHRYYPDFKIGERFFDTKNDYLVVKDKDKIERVSKQNNVIIEVVNKSNITKEFIQKALIV